MEYMNILIIGSCRNNDLESKSEKGRKLAEELGGELARRGHSVFTGGAGGLMGLVVDSYKKNNGKEWVVYWAKDEKQDKCVETPAHSSPDKEIQTGFNYAMRDAFYVGEPDGIIALSGKLLTLAEIIHAVRNYNKKVFQLEIGDNIKIIKNSSDLKDGVFVSLNINDGLKFLEAR